MLEDKVKKILINAGWTEGMIAAIDEKQAEHALALIGYDKDGELLESLTKIEKILVGKAGLGLGYVREMHPQQIQSLLHLGGYDEFGEKFPQPEEPKAQVIDSIEEEEYTISGSAENTMNLGNYSSAKRGVFVGKKFKIAKNLSDAERFAKLREETKKVQMLAETQLSGICMEAMGPSGFDDASWLTISSRVFKNAMAKTKAVFGIKEEPKAPAAT